MSVVDNLEVPGMLLRIGEKLKVVQLQHGSHKTGMNKGVCVMECVSALYPGQSHTDHPACVTPSILSLGILCNDTLSETKYRQVLWKFIPRFMGTDEDGLDKERATAGVNWLRENGVNSETSASLETVCTHMKQKVSNTPESGGQRAAVVDAALSALMPHEPPSLAKLQWENLQATYGQTVNLSQPQIDQYIQAGLAVSL